MPKGGSSDGRTAILWVWCAAGLFAIVLIGCASSGDTADPETILPSTIASVPVSLQAGVAVFDGDPKHALEGLPPREEIPEDAMVTYDNLVRLHGELERANEDVRRLTPIYRRLNQKASKAAKAYRRGDVPYSVTAKASGRSGRAWDRQFEARGDASALMLRVAQAREQLDEKLATG